MNALFFIIALLFFLAGAFNAVMDVLESRWEKSVFSAYPRVFPPAFWGAKQKTWVNKYDAQGKRKIWFRLFKIDFYLPVAFTDAWHLAKSGMLTTSTIAVILCLASAGLSWGGSILMTVLFRLAFSFGFVGFYNKWLILSVACFFVSVNIQAQEINRRQARLLDKLEKSGLQISDNADTIFIEKPVLRTVIRRDTVYLNRVRVQYRDTCEATRYELRHERKTQKAANDLAETKLRTDLQAAKLEIEKLREVARRENQNLRLNLRQERILNQARADSLKTIRQLARTETRKTRIEHRGWGLWDWIFYALSVFGAVAVGRYTNFKIRRDD